MNLFLIFFLANLTIFHAGSLAPLMEELTKEFTKETGIKVQRRAGGSLFLARIIEDERTEWDLFFSADEDILEKMKSRYCDTVIPFASNEIVIAYTPKSRFAQDINALNWPEILSRGGVRIGRANPELDPCGYRTLILFEILKTSKDTVLAKKIINNSGTSFVRPKSAEISNLLEMGEIDYAFLYLSDAKIRNLPYINLNDSLNFSNFDLVEFYKKFNISLQSETIEGKPIVYAFCINKQSINKESVKAFLRFWETKGIGFVKKYHLKPLPKDKFLVPVERAKISK